ncbi:glycosyltransferase [Litoribaculum gwangyangense]|uniref:Glycosyltransferase n=1 Tax=Litoribaculum gwangyangense TaxID=1130722 RepID=A0ABP9CWN5_9FLAO
MTSKKILHVVSSMDPVLGGVCKAVRIIATSLIQQGIVNEVVCLDHPNDDFVTKETFKLYALGKHNNPWGYHPKLLPWLQDHIHNYDYVIVHGLWLYNSFAVYKAFKRNQRALGLKHQKHPKYYVMPHGMLDPYFQKASGRRLKAIRNWLYWKGIENKVVNYGEGLLFTCEEERLLARKPFHPYHPKSELVVGLGVEAPPMYQPPMDAAFFNKCQGLEKRPYLLFLSRIHEKKGVDLLLEAYKKIRDNPSNNTILPALVIAGPGGDSEYGKKMMKFVSDDEKLKDSIFFPGMLAGDAKWGAFYNCVAFVLPSHQENFGIAIVEALACKKPVLISNQINIWKEIVEGKAGFVNDDTLNGTITLLNRWMDGSFNDKSVMAQQAEHCYKTCFSIEALIDNWTTKVLT